MDIPKAYSNDSEDIHGVDPTLAVPYTEKTILPPVVFPTILANPTMSGIVIPNDCDAMPSL
jgi:hypothetical protein